MSERIPPLSFWHRLEWFTARIARTTGFSLLREPFLTPIMLGGLAGALAAFALLWTLTRPCQPPSNRGAFR